MPKSEKDARARAARVKILLMDVDGVLTDGRLSHFVDTAGRLVEFKGIHAQDSLALTWLPPCGVQTGIISGRLSQGVEERAKMLKMAYIYQHRLDKKAVLDEICGKAGVAPDQVLFIGDDFPDIQALKAVGLGVAVKNARPEVKAAARWVTRAEGGSGAVREVVEMVLRAKGLWKDLLARYQAR